MSFFTVEGLAAGYGRRPVLSGIDFTLEAGKLYGVLGANGSGKTTLLGRRPSGLRKTMS